jgi:uncharacterized protein YdeI (YjbR/CyaY-like superfamily)
MKRANTVQEYIEIHPRYREELILLRDILLDTEVVETIKWGAPCYTVDEKNIVGIGAFKSYIGLWFHQGVFLKDKKKVLINAQEGTTKALRQWRFESIKDINPKLVKEYIEEAIDNQKQGKEMKAVKAKTVATPTELRVALKSNSTLNKCYNALTPGKQREYSEHIGSAKQEKTRLSRLDKSIPLILEGKGLHDKYK